MAPPGRLPNILNMTTQMLIPKSKAVVERLSPSFANLIMRVERVDVGRVDDDEAASAEVEEEVEVEAWGPSQAESPSIPGTREALNTLLITSTGHRFVVVVLRFSASTCCC